MDCDGPRQHATSHVATVKGWKSIECGAVLPGSRTLKRMFKIVTCTTFATFFVNLFTTHFTICTIYRTLLQCTFSNKNDPSKRITRHVPLYYRYQVDHLNHSTKVLSKQVYRHLVTFSSVFQVFKLNLDPQPPPTKIEHVL
jgi:hypothetical protein